jgi:CRP-like cAMP-binding protein/membrane protease YdiL (CAAX protease family)
MSVSHSLFRGLAEAERHFLERLIDVEHFEPGEVFIREGERNADLYLIRSGRAILTKGEGEAKVAIGEVGPEDVLGELSFLDNSPRSLSIEAIEPLQVSRLRRAHFAGDDPIAERVLHQIERNIALLSTERLRRRSDDFVRGLRREVELLREQVDFGTLFIIMVILFGLNGFILNIIQTHFSDYYYFTSPNYTFLYATLIDWGGFLLFAAPVVYLVKAIHFPIREVLNIRTNLRQTLRESLAISAVVFLVVVPASFGLISLPFVPEITEDFDLQWFMIVFTPDYLLHSYIQELVARGIMQNAIQKFLRDDKGHRTIIICSVAFAVMHMHLGATFALTTGLAAVVFGYIYLRHRNLLGVTLVHWVVGALVMRYMTVLGMLAA